MVILSADDMVCIFVCCLDEASCTGCYRCLGDAWVMLGLVFKWFPLCEFYLILPRVSSLVVYSL